MPNQRREGKKMLSFWGTEEELDLLKQATKAAGFTAVADYLRWVAHEQPKPGQKPQPPKSKSTAGTAAKKKK
jgi:hypothetical protein